MKENKNRNNIYSPYINMKNNNYFLYTDTLNNIKRAYTSVKRDHKNFILSLVAYNNNKQLLKVMGYKFTSFQFKKAIEKELIKILI